MVARSIFSDEEAQRIGAIAANAVDGGTQAKAVAFILAYNHALNIKHAFLVVTAEGTSLADGQIEAVYSYGPANDEFSAEVPPLGMTVRKGPGSPTYRDDFRALDSIADGGLAAPGVTYSEIEGLSNDVAHQIFGAPSEPRVYNPVPGTVPGTTNSNSEAHRRAQAGARAAGTEFQPPAGVMPGARQADRVVPERHEEGY